METVRSTVIQRIKMKTEKNGKAFSADIKESNNLTTSCNKQYQAADRKSTPSKSKKVTFETSV